MMVTRSTQRAAHTEPAATAVRYFQLYEALTIESHALAYPCRWDTKESTWKKIDVPQEMLRTIHDRKGGNGAKADDIVQCVWMAGSRRWEILSGGSAFFRGSTTGTLSKGGSVGVTRYEPGTTDPSGDTDTVHNELVTVSSGKVVYYMRDGDNFYMFAAECPL